MTADERRRAILEALCQRRHETRENLAFEFGVSKRTIEYDVVRLSQSYPIYTTKGTGGGIHVMEGYRLDGSYLSAEEQSFLGTYLFSRDTYFLCTPKRDREFEEVFADRVDLNGSRIKTAMYLRRYVE